MGKKYFNAILFDIPWQKHEKLKMKEKRKMKNYHCSCVFLSTRSVVRLAASLITKLVDSLAPSITSVLVHGKQVSGQHAGNRHSRYFCIGNGCGTGMWKF